VLKNLNKSISSKSATTWGLVFCLPFAFAFFTAITDFKPFLNLTAYNGRATYFGLAIFYIGLICLPLAFIVNFFSMLTSKNGKISFHPKPINLIIALVALTVVVVFGGHLIIDQIACLNGNIPACD